MTASSLAPRAMSVTLPPLHGGRDGQGGQVAIDLHPARFKVVLCGRRWGKTTMGVRTCVKGALATGGVYWWVAPNYPEINASRAWTTLKMLAVQVPGTQVWEADHYIKFANGGEIWVKSADKEDNLRGAGLSGVVLDEMAQIKEEVWTDILRPALTDHKGWAMFIGTPKGKNWVYRLWNKAGQLPNWARWRKPSVDNPYLDPDEIEEARRDLSEEKFKQEFEADFGASSYLVFPEFDRDIHVWKGAVPPFVKFGGGLDFGGDAVGNHKSAGAVGGITADGTLILIREFEQYGANIGERQLNWIQESDWRVQQLLRANGNRGGGKVLWRADKTQMWGIELAHKMLGVNVFKSKGGKDSILAGCDLIHMRLRVQPDGKPKLYVLPELHRTIAAFERYAFPEPDPSKVMPPNPIAIDDDLIDSIRYLVEGIDARVLGDPQQLYAGQLGRIQ